MCMCIFFVFSQIQGLIYMVVAQMITQPLSVAEQSMSNTCSAGGNSTESNLKPEDWTGKHCILTPETQKTILLSLYMLIILTNP